MSRTLNTPFNILVNTKDKNCKSLGTSSFMYYLNEPIQLLNSLKFECKVQLISMPKKAKAFEFSVCKQLDLHPLLTESKLISHKFVCTS